MEAPNELDLVDVGASGLTDRRAINRPPLLGCSEDRVDIRADESKEREASRQNVILARDDRHSGGEIVADLERTGLRESLAIGSQRRESDPSPPHHLIEIVAAEHAMSDNTRDTSATIALFAGQPADHIDSHTRVMSRKRLEKILQTLPGGKLTGDEGEGGDLVSFVGGYNSAHEAAVRIHGVQPMTAGRTVSRLLVFEDLIGQPDQPARVGDASRTQCTFHRALHSHGCAAESDNLRILNRVMNNQYVAT